MESLTLKPRFDKSKYGWSIINHTYLEISMFCPFDFYKRNRKRLWNSTSVYAAGVRIASQMAGALDKVIAVLWISDSGKAECSAWLTLPIETKEFPDVVGLHELNEAITKVSIPVDSYFDQSKQSWDMQPIPSPRYHFPL